MRQKELPCVLMRAGTSKGAFLHARDLPPAGPERDALLVRLMGSPDILQIDGLGGSRPITSKIAIVSLSDRHDADVDYLFSQVEIEAAEALYGGNCGNISSGVGPFAIDEGLVPATGPLARVRVYNVNTDKIFVAHVPVENGRAVVDGDFAIPGVPGTGAEIVLDYTATAGAKTGRLLPTGNARDTITMEDGRSVAVTISDIGNPTIWLRAADLGIDGSILPTAIDADPALLAIIGEVRGKGAVLAGMCRDWRKVDVESPGLPTIGFVAPPETYRASNGILVDADDTDLRARLLFMGRSHESMAGTASVSLATASRIPGSVVHEATRDHDADTIRIGHPLGSMTVKIVATPSADAPYGIDLSAVGFSRTARRLMAGVAYLPGA